jgi:hypothetical protein
VFLQETLSIPQNSFNEEQSFDRDGIQFVLVFGEAFDFNVLMVNFLEGGVQLDGNFDDFVVLFEDLLLDDDEGATKNR